MCPNPANGNFQDPKHHPCSRPGPIIPGLKGQLIFDSGFEKYIDEAIQKFFIHQAASSNHMDADFLHSLGNNAIRLSSARVKVINAENPCCGTIRQWEGYSFCD